MTILVLSDTHRTDGAAVPVAVHRFDGSVDLIVHAGDFTGADFLDALGKVAPVIGVKGNMDSPEIAAILPEIEEITLQYLKIGVIHGRGSPGDVPYFARASFDKPDLIIFGHTHVPYLEKINGAIMLNPGSLTSPRHSSRGTCAVIALTDEEATIRIITPLPDRNEELVSTIIRRPV